MELTGVLLSIKPKYVKDILSGVKQYEFRKQIFKNESAKTVFIYSSSPQKKIVACFRVGKIVEGHPDYLWEQFWDVSGVSEQEFFEYFSDRDTGTRSGSIGWSSFPSRLILTRCSSGLLRRSRFVMWIVRMA